MPIEIKEMHIKINVSEGGSPTSNASSSADTGSMVQECLDQMTKILNDKDER